MIKKVLICDDNSANLYLLEILLKGHGLAVTTAENGRNALDKARLNPPDLIITDILMPVMDGYALCREWKVDDTLKHIPLVFYTATYIESKDEAFALGLGADRFIVKPQDPEVFMNLIKEVLEENYASKQVETKPLGEEMEFFRQHNEILFHKLEKKMLDLEMANRKLRIMEERYRLSFENVTDVVYTIDTDLNVLDVSPSVERILGYTPQDFIGHPVSALGNIFTPESFEQAAADASLILKGETIPATIYRFVTRDGTQKIGEVSGSPVKRNGNIIGMISVARDITAHKRVEEKLRESEKKYRELYDFLPIPVYEMDLEGNITSVNRAIYETFGGTEEDLKKGFKAWQMLSPIEIDKSSKNIQRLLNGEQLKGTEYIIMRLDGSVFPAIVISSVIYNNGKPMGFRGAIIDIADRKLAEEALRESEEVFRLLFEKSSDAHLLIDGNKYIDCNEAALRIAGCTDKSMLINLAPADLSPERQPNDELSKEKIKRMMEIATNEGTNRFEWVFRRFDGAERFLDVTLTLIPMKGKKLLHTTWRDITESIRIQKEQERLQSQLIQAQKMEAVGTLAGGIAHDFNNILTAIMGYTELYKDEVHDRPNVYKGMEQVLKAAERAKDLVRQILTFSRKTEHEKKPIALAPIVNEVVHFMRASLPTTIEINPKIEATSDIIMGDPSQLHQVLVNLCTNAGHAMKDIGGILEIGLEKVAIDADDLLHSPSVKPGHYMALTIRDTGRGISRENLERIFEPYFTTKEKGEGTGLGLAVVHGIVKDHGGEIRVYSERGKGTDFRVYLPLMENLVEDEPGKEETAPPGSGETILFVDDEKMVVDLNKKVLETLGYRVVTETDPVKAIEVFAERCDAFDLVITDKTMPHMTGFDLARAIRKVRADIPVILCSGFQEKGDMEKLTSLGISKLMIKPTRKSLLAKTIRDVLDKEEIREPRDNGRSSPM